MPVMRREVQFLDKSIPISIATEFARPDLTEKIERVASGVDGLFFYVRGKNLEIKSPGLENATVPDVIAAIRSLRLNITLGIFLDYKSREFGARACADALVQVLKSADVKYIIFSRDVRVLRKLRSLIFRTGIVRKGNIGDWSELITSLEKMGCAHLVVDYNLANKDAAINMAGDAYHKGIQIWLRANSTVPDVVEIVASGVGIIYLDSGLIG